jgi:anti-sigma B factor antagonist
MQTATRNAGDVTIIDIAGELRLADLDHLRYIFREALERGAKKLLLNMARVTAIDDAAIDELRSLHVAADRNGAKLRLYSLTQRAVEQLELTKLLTLFDTYENEADALAGFGG